MIELLNTDCVWFVMAFHIWRRERGSGSELS